MKNVALQILINNIDQTSILKNFILSINIENSFNSDLRPGQISIEFSSNVSITWLFNDTIRILVWWEDEPLNKFDSGIYYIDNISDSLSEATQNYVVKASQQFLTFQVDSVLSEADFNPKTVYYFTNMMGYIMSKLLINNYTLPTFSGNSNSLSINTYKFIENPPTSIDFEVSNTWGGHFDTIIDFCKKFGLIANLTTNSKFTMYQIEALSTLPLSFNNDSSRTLLELSHNINPNIVSRIYRQWYALPGLQNGGTVTSLTTSAINNRTLTSEDRYNALAVNQLSAARMNVGNYYQHLLETNTINMTFIGNPKLSTGIKFNLGLNYGRYSKEYFALRVVQKISEGEWISSVEAFPVNLALPVNLQVEMLFNLFDTLQPPPIDPLFSIVVGKFINAVGYDNPTKRLSFFTVERVLNWVRLNSLNSNLPRTYTDIEINDILTPLINECITNNIRQDIAVAYAVAVTNGFTRARAVGNNVFTMRNQALTIDNSFASLPHSGSGLCQRLTRVGTIRGYVGTPRDTQVGTWTQNGFNNLSLMSSLSLAGYVTRARMETTLNAMYVEMGISQYTTFEP